MLLVNFLIWYFFWYFLVLVFDKLIIIFKFFGFLIFIIFDCGFEIVILIVLGVFVKCKFLVL